MLYCNVVSQLDRTIYPRLLNWSFTEFSDSATIVDDETQSPRNEIKGRWDARTRFSRTYEIATVAQTRRIRDALCGGSKGVISISRYALRGPRSPKHSIDPGSTHLSLEERAEGFHFREAVTCRGRYLALLSHAPRAVPFLSLPLRFPLALMSS